MADPLDMVKAVVLNARARLAQVVPDTPSATDAPAVSAARPLLQGVYDAWSTIESILANLAGQLALTMNDARWAPAERDRQLRDAVNAARTATSSAFDDMERNVNDLRARMSGFAGVQRPTPVDATQEARISSIKADCRMVLDGLTGGEVTERLASFTRDALARGDDLAGWVLTSSGWPALYLESRGLDDYVAVLNQEIGGLLDSSASGDTAAARTVLVIIDSPKGLAGLLVGARTYLRMALDDITRGVPA